MDAIPAFLNELTGMEFTIHGWLAILAGSLGTIALNGGLMWLVVFSNRRGHDVDADNSGQGPDR